MAANTTEPDVDLDLVARIRVSVARLNRQLRQQSGTGLTLTVQSALVTIEKHGPLSLGDLAGIEQIAPATVTKIVTRLVEDGLVDRTVDPTDRRVTLVELSPAGAERLADTRTRRNAWLVTRLSEPGAPDLDSVRVTAAVLEQLARPAETDR